MQVSHLGHIEILSPKLEETVTFFKELVGLEETTRTANSVYLRAWGDWDLYTLVVSRASHAGMVKMGVQVRTAEDLRELEQQLEAAGYPYNSVTAGTFLGLGQALHTHLPGGQLLEIYANKALYQAPAGKQTKLLNQPQKPTFRGANAFTFDHVNLLSSDVSANRQWLETFLGIKHREGLLLDDDTVEGGAWMSWSSRAHDVALMKDMTGSSGRLHHLCYYLESRDDLLRAADVLAEADIRLEAGPGKHGITQALFLYCLEPGGNRVELFAGGYHIQRPDWKPVMWGKDNLERSIVWWGSPLPETFFIYGTGGAEPAEMSPAEPATSTHQTLDAASGRR
jgi:catechol 2,3-dioxygenase